MKSNIGFGIEVRKTSKHIDGTDVNQLFVIPNKNTEYTIITLDRGFINRETDKAFSFIYSFKWIPKSQVVFLENGDIAVKNWLIKKNGLDCRSERQDKNKKIMDQLIKEYKEKCGSETIPAEYSEEIRRLAVERGALYRDNLDWNKIPTSLEV
jgi:hypothetical protein